MIKNITNTNRLTQIKNTSITLVATMFVIISLIVLRAPLSYFDSTTLELPLMLGSIFSLHSIEFLDFLQSARFIFSQRCLVLFPKNSKILSHKICLDYTSKYIRWLTQILQSQPNMKRLQWTSTKIHKIIYPSHISHKRRIYALLIEQVLNFNLQIEWFQERSFNPYKK